MFLAPAASATAEPTSLLRRFRLNVLAFLLALTVMTPGAQAGYAHVLVDMATGEVLAEENADAINHPASLTKMMTLYLTFDALHQGTLSWDSRIPISERAAQTPPYKFALPVGATFTVREAVEGMIVISANDAAESMCDYFAAKAGRSCGEVMTSKARGLGMSRTTFVNGSGLHEDGQVTTARDMATLATALIRDFPEEYKLFQKKYFTFRSMKLRGHNSLMYRYEGMDGLKTGFTDASGYNLASSAVRGGRRLVGAILGADSGADRANRMEALMDVAFGTRDRSEALMALAPMRPSLSPDPLPAASETASSQTSAASEAAAILAAPPTAPSTAGKLAPTQVSKVTTARSDWEVQVAAVDRPEAAAEVLDDARKALGDRFGQVVPFTQTISRENLTLIRARLTGFDSKAEATEACNLLKAQTRSCFVVNSRA